MGDFPDEVSSEQAAQQLITLTEAAKRSGLSRSHIRLLVRQGRIWGRKMGRDWFTTEAAVIEYLSAERKPGPKPSKRH